MSAPTYIVILLGLIVAMCLTLVLSVSRFTKDRARERRMAEHKMNARLLRLNL